MACRRLAAHFPEGDLRPGRPAKSLLGLPFRRRPKLGLVVFVEARASQPSPSSDEPAAGAGVPVGGAPPHLATPFVTPALLGPLLVSSRWPHAATATGSRVRCAGWMGRLLGGRARRVWAPRAVPPPAWWSPRSSREANDLQQLEPMLQAVDQTLGATQIADRPGTLPADSGYWSIANLTTIPDAPRAAGQAGRHRPHRQTRNDGRPPGHTNAAPHLNGGEAALAYRATNSHGRPPRGEGSGSGPVQPTAGVASRRGFQQHVP
jgi:hypothetical protein